MVAGSRLAWAGVTVKLVNGREKPIKPKETMDTCFVNESRVIYAISPQNK
jgi:hypothetical protein